MIIWCGWGFLVLVIYFAIAIVINLVVDAAFGSGYWDKSAWPLALAFIMSSVPIWFLGKHLNAKGGRTVIDAETGEVMVIGGNHSFFFIKMQYWGPIALLFAAIALVTK